MVFIMLSFLLKQLSDPVTSVLESANLSKNLSISNVHGLVLQEEAVSTVMIFQETKNPKWTIYFDPCVSLWTDAMQELTRQKTFSSILCELNAITY